MSNGRAVYFRAAPWFLCLVVPLLVTACAKDKQDLDVVPVASAEENPEHNYKPEEGYVPDAETAIQIAVAVWIPIYGKEQIASEKPYRASLNDGIWYVKGSLPEGPGGVAEAEIAKDDGCILRISHGE